jgi:hypothetical protein
MLFKLALAGVISGSGFAGTYLWHRHTMPSEQSSTSKPVARVTYFNNEVERKLKTKFIWQGVSKDALLGTGESLRTGGGSDARIEFLGTGTVIDLEQDSLIVIEENAGKVALDFLAGNLFVKGGEGTGDITLKSGESSIALQGADLSLGKDKKGELNLQVFNGSATVQSGGKSTSLKQNEQASLGAQGLNRQANSIDVLAPLPTNPVYLSVLTPKPIRFQWKPLAADYNIQLETGPARGDLQALSGISAPSTGGSLEAPVKIGTVFWRLVARGRDPASNLPTLFSPVFKMQVLPLSPPVALKPLPDQSMRLSPDQLVTEFAWANPAKLGHVRLEISKRPDFKDKIFDQSFSNDESKTGVELKDGGVYYWRISGPAPVTKNEKQGALSTDVQKFTLQTKSEIVPPQLKAPRPAERLAMDAVKDSGVVLSWEAVSDASGYRVTVQSTSQSASGPVNKEVPINRMAFRDLKPGEYTWRVEAKDSTGLFSKHSEERKFKIEETHVLKWSEWNGGATPEVVMFPGDKPSLSLAWEKGPDEVKSWQLRVTGEDVNDDSQKAPRKLGKPEFQGELATQGHYTVEAEGLSADGFVVARTPKRLLHFKKILPPDAPTFQTSVPPLIQATRSGDALLTWLPVVGANSYMIQLKAQDGTVIKEVKFSETKGELTSLMPGDYKVCVYASDKHGQRSPASETRNLRVPEINSLAKPKVKRLKIK